MINATVTGNLGRDPEKKGEGPVVVAIASTNGYGDRKTTTWVRVAFWGKQGESALAHLKKGSAVAVAGFMYVREWESDGRSGSVLEMDGQRWEFSGPKPEATGGRRNLTTEEAYNGMTDDGMPF
tara:strand:+ start:373 stop:744 length:372 start_codon:yes stop_codon:yes gene_type:complete